MNVARPPAIILLSGGLDSTTMLAIARAEGFSPYALSFNYGQRHDCELAAARRVAEAHGVVEHFVVDLDLRQFGGSALTADIPVPKSRSIDAIGDSIPVTYVPARNTIFLSLALAAAETRGANDIFIGVNAVDYSGYPDCRPEYIAAFQRMADLATRVGVEGGKSPWIHTPLIDLTKAEIIKLGIKLGVNYALTISCYDPSAQADARGRSNASGQWYACGQCEACRLRLKGFAENGLEDPAPYVARDPRAQR